jgi:hypothetical protein
MWLEKKITYRRYHMRCRMLRVFPLCHHCRMRCHMLLRVSLLCHRCHMRYHMLREHLLLH